MFNLNVFVTKIYNAIYSLNDKGKKMAMIIYYSLRSYLFFGDLSTKKYDKWNNGKMVNCTEHEKLYQKSKLLICL